MKTFLIVLFILGLCVIGLGFNIFFLKKDFPAFDVGSNEEMRKRGIRCFKDEDAALHSNKHCTGDFTEACKECKLYESGSNSRTS